MRMINLIMSLWLAISCKNETTFVASSLSETTSKTVNND